ncbi:MAG: rhomboid family intramembrane serine protease [Candidatus Acidiferrales bacterium]
MIPLKSDNPRASFPAMNVLLIATNAAIFLYELSLPPRAGNRLIYEFGLVPARLNILMEPTRHMHAAHGTIEAAVLPLLTCMFLHAGWLHLLGNMLFLWVFGGSVEDRMGHIGYLVFYLVCGLGAGAVHTAFNWGSTVPTIGASGAISGVMGAYIVLFPRSRILTLVPLLIIFFFWRIPAVLILGYWFVLQFLSGLSAAGGADQSGVAVWAHVGGFVIGALLTVMLGLRRPVTAT